MRLRGGEARSAERALALAAFVSAVRDGDLAELMGGLSIAVEGERTLCVVPRGKIVRVSMSGCRVVVEGRGVERVVLNTSKRLPFATFLATRDFYSRTIWVQRVVSLNRIDCRQLAWSVQRHLLSNHFRTDELARCGEVSIRLLPRVDYSPEAYHRLYRENFNLAKAILLEPCSPGPSILVTYFKPYLRSLRFGFALRLVKGAFCTEDGSVVVGVEEVEAAEKLAGGRYALSLPLKNAAAFLSLLRGRADSELVVEEEPGPVHVRVDGRCRKKVFPTKDELITFIERKTTTYLKLARGYSSI